MAAQNLTQEYLKKHFHYDDESGVFTRLIARRGFKSGCQAGTARKDGYIAIQIDFKIYPAARLAFLYMTGKLPTRHMDHIDGNPSNNAWINLREVTAKENSKNQKKPKNNTSGHIGVGWDSATKKWVSQIMVNGKTIKLGRFTDIENAINARIAANLFYNFHQNHGRIT